MNDYFLLNAVTFSLGAIYWVVLFYKLSWLLMIFGPHFNMGCVIYVDILF